LRSKRSQDGQIQIQSDKNDGLLNTQEKTTEKSTKMKPPDLQNNDKNRKSKTCEKGKPEKRKNDDSTALLLVFAPQDQPQKREKSTKNYITTGQDDGCEKTAKTDTQKAHKKHQN